MGQDTGLVLFCKQYQASAHLWLALHAHRRADADQTALVAHHSEQACGILNTEPNSARKSSPKQAAGTNKITSGPPKAKQRLARKAVPPREPVTPKSKTRKGKNDRTSVLITTDISVSVSLYRSVAAYVVECVNTSTAE
jgi:separase